MKKLVALFIAGMILGTATTIAASRLFSDVPEGTWYTGAVQRLSEWGVVKGYKDGTFRPNQNVTRAELAVMLDRTIAMLENPNFNAENVEMESYSNSDFNISFDHPSNWVVEEYDESVTFKDENDQTKMWVFPKGENDFGLPMESELKTEMISVDGYKAKNDSYFNNEAGVLSLLSFSEVPDLWNSDGYILFNYSVWEMQTIESIIESIRFE